MSVQTGEYGAARNGVVVATRTDRGFVRVYGRDPVRMIQGLITNDIANAPPERAVYAAVLTPKGKMVADVRVLRHGDDLLLDVDAGATESVIRHLRKFVPPLFARFEDAGSAWSAIGVYGPRARDTVVAVCGEDVFGGRDIAEDDVFTASISGAAVMVIATAHFDVPGFDIVLPTAAVADARSALERAGAQTVQLATLDVLRIEAGRPRWGVDLDENTIPLEAGLRDRAISETKGCYTGQEVIVRILHRGHVNWLLRSVLLGDAPPPPRDTALLAATDYRKIGRITSAAWSPKLGQTVALGYVRREVEPGTKVHLETATGPLVTVVEAGGDDGSDDGRRRD